MRKQLIVLGAGESGASAARLAQRQGYAVLVSDAGKGNPRYLEELAAAGIDYETGGHTPDRILTADEVVKSPGIPDTAPLVVTLKERGIPVISEIEFASRFVAAAKIIGITGSNGKTTTTLLTQHILQRAGVKSLAGGNLGDSFARLLLDHPAQDVYVLELSSFQLDGTETFRPAIAAILNITPDHLDRYDYSLEKYADSKLRIARSQHADDHLLVLLDPKTIAPALRRNKVSAEVTTVDAERSISGTKIRVDGRAYDLAHTPLAGRHNAMNACFAIRIAQLLGVNDNTISTALTDFVPAPHRMEIVPTQDDRRWINDSKATNVDSTFYALEAMTGPTVWIAGGTDKGNDYGVLFGVIGRVHTLICLGLDNDKLMQAFDGRIDSVEENKSMESAILRAAEVADAGWTILLSPACASFDLFKNYEDRGDQFRELVKNHFA